MCGYALYHVDETYVGIWFYFLLNHLIVPLLQGRFHAFGYNGLASGNRSASYGRVGEGQLYRIGYPNQPGKAYHVLVAEEGCLFLHPHCGGLRRKLNLRLVHEG